MFSTLTKALHETVSIIQVISSFFVFNKPLEIPSYIPLFSQCLHLHIASIIFEIKIVPTDCSIRVSQSFAAIFKMSHDLIFSFLN